MGDEDIDMVGAKTLQAGLEFVPYRLRAEIAVDRLAILLDECVALVGVPDEAAFGDQNDIVAAPFYGAADDFLGAAQSIGRCGIDQRDAGIERGMYRGNRCFVVAATPHPAAHGPGSEAHCACGDAAFADLTCQLHLVPLS